MTSAPWLVVTVAYPQMLKYMLNSTKISLQFKNDEKLTNHDKDIQQFRSKCCLQYPIFQPYSYLDSAHQQPMELGQSLPMWCRRVHSLNLLDCETNLHRS